MTGTRKKILAVSGSTRQNATNELVLKAIAKLYPETLEVQIYQELTALPPFNPDAEELTDSVQRWRTLIAQADGVIICTPEYVFSLPGTLKNALEWTVASTVFSDKPVAVIVASGLGEKAYESLLLIMNTLGAKIGDQAQLLISGARSKINAQGQITDETTLRQLQQLGLSLLATINTTAATHAADRT